MACDGLESWQGTSVDQVLDSKLCLAEGKGCNRQKLCQTRRLCIDQCDLRCQRVLIRVDFDSPMKDGYITNIEHIEAALPSIQLAFLRGQEVSAVPGAKSVILISHLGNPGGKVEESLSLRPVAAVLENKLGIPVTFVDDCVGGKVEALCADPPTGSLILLENLRFHKEEEGEGIDKQGHSVMATASSIKRFRASLTKLADVYINDAFCASHMPHSSIVGCSMTQRACGLQMKARTECFFNLLRNSKTPFLAIVGGAKVSDKLLMIEHLLDHVTEMIIVGGIALAFLKVLRNMEIGDSASDRSMFDEISQMMKHAACNGVNLHLPLDFVVADRCSDNATAKSCTIDEGIPAGFVCVDIGARSRKLFAKIIGQARTVVWNGPPGFFEWDDFAHGSQEMMIAVVQCTQRGGETYLFGGDTVTCAQKFQAREKVTHLSSDGATLEILEGKILPGLFALSTQPHQMIGLCKLGIDGCLFVNKRVIIRVDFDVPIINGKIAANQKLRDALPTILYVIEHGAKSVVLVSHLGCPNGQRVATLSLKPVADELERLLCRQVIFLNDCVGKEIEKYCVDPRPCSVFLLENLKFHIEEEGSHIGPLGKRTMANPEAVRVFRQSLGQLADIFINDKLENAHTKHSSTTGIDLPVKMAGFHLMKELDFFNTFLYKAQRPFVAIIGGISLTGKLVLIDHLLDLADDIIIAGGVAFTFLKVLHGISVGSSAYDKCGAALVPIIIDRARANNVRIILPKDIVVANKYDPAGESRTVGVTADIDDAFAGLDVGVNTQAMFADVINKGRSILWHGPPGVFEIDTYSAGTESIVKAIVEANCRGAITVVQGCDTVACCKKFQAESQISHICNKNGVNLEHVLEGALPGVDFLDWKLSISEHCACQERLTHKKVDFIQSEAERHVPVPNKWTPPYTKKLPPLPTYQPPRPRIKYTGAPPPGMSIPSPYSRRETKFGASNISPSTQVLSELPNACGQTFPCHATLPPLLPTPKARVPVQMETLATIDSSQRLTVHVNGDSKSIAQHAAVQVTLVEGYIPLNQFGKKASESQKFDQRRRIMMKKRNVSPNRLSTFKHRISLANLQEACRQMTPEVLPRKRPRRAESMCSRKPDVFPM